MTILQALLFGLVQGLTEFLPISSSIGSSVSSSGHLLLLQKILDIEGYSLWIKVLLHAGALAAVVFVYRQRLWDMIRHPVKSELWLLAIATVPAVAASLLTTFDDAFAGQYIGWSFLITTLILWFADLIASVAPRCKAVKWHHALFMGLMQAIAMMLPGVSRSGASIAGGVSTGLSRRSATDFSFLMFIPAILVSLAFTLGDLFGAHIPFTEGPLVGITAFISSALFGWLAIFVMRAIIRRIRLSWFGLYTGILGVLILIDQYFLHIFL